ncbi:MAG: SDR family oxidoreductase [Bacteroidia bacterium]
MTNHNFLTKHIEGKSILITGGTTGIGRAAAILLSSQGADIIVAGLDEGHLKDALVDINKVATGAVYGIIADISTGEGVQLLFEKVDSVFITLDILINNAALPFESITEGSYSDWKRIVDTNLLGYIACAGEAVRRMKEKGNGHIINVGSMSADVREETGSVYVATKSGIQGFSESLRKQVNPMGIRVGLLEPGATDTDMQPDSTQQKKQQVEREEMLTADDIAGILLYMLCQPRRCDIVELKVKPRLQLI